MRTDVESKSKRSKTAIWRFVPAQCSRSFFSSCSPRCGGGGGTAGGPIPTPSNAPAAPKRAQDVIKHVVVIVQENRSFDNLFQGFPGADTVASGKASDGSTIPLKPVSLSHGVDPSHDYADFVASEDGGKMDGFDQVSDVPQNEANLSYAYVPRAEAQPYFDLATAYALADRMFQSNNSASYPAHQYVIAAQSGNVVNVPTAIPWGCDAPAGTTVTHAARRTARRSSRAPRRASTIRRSPTRWIPRA